MNNNLLAGVGSSGVAVTASVSSWVAVANDFIQLGGSLLALLSGAVSLYFLLKSRRKDG